MRQISQVSTRVLGGENGASETSKSQLYHYFADKDVLVLAVIPASTECVLTTHGAYLSGGHINCGVPPMTRCGY